MKALDIRELFKNFNDFESKEISINGWVRSNRDSKNFGFLVINDGTFIENLQIVYDNSLENFQEIAKVGVGASITAIGTLVQTPNAKQPFELKAIKVNIVGASDPDYPLQKKRHGFEFLRTIPHLRPRTNTFEAVFRVRSLTAFAIHKFFNEKGFVYVNTPIITGSDCEGAGEQFRVTTLNHQDLPMDGKKVDYSKDFFSKEAFLSVSGQLHGEGFAQAFKKIYTFGPTFRSENSNTTRHAAEFWMMEPEIAFCDLSGCMDNAEEMIKYVIRYVLENAKEEIEFFNQFIEKGLIDKLTNIINSEFGRITYTEAVDILEKNNENFEYKVSWGCDLQTEHERFLTEKIFKKPIFVTNYPKEIKAFYMKLNDDGKTVAACDLLVPGIGELIGGSQREDDLEKLTNILTNRNMNLYEYKFYLDLRKYGSTPHSGYGLGFERCLMYLTGMANIRDVLAYPRTVGNLEL